MPRVAPSSAPSAPPLRLTERLRRGLTPTKLWNGRFEDLALDALSLLRRGTTDFFKVVEIETSTACNRRCSYCPNSAFDRGLLKNEQRMSEELYDRLLGQLADIGFDGRMSPHFYGEPLLDERLESWIARARARVPLMKIIVFSNGDYLDVPRYESLVRAGVDGLLVTQHSEGELKGVTAVIAHRKAHGTSGVRFDFRAFDTKTELSNRGGLVGHELLETKADCDMPSENVTIDHQGNVILCCNDYHSEHSFGNVGQEHLLDIWNKPEYQTLRARLRDGHFDREICVRCAAGAGALSVGAPSSEALPTDGARQLPVLQSTGPA